MKFLTKDNKIPVSIWWELILPLMQEGYQLKICPAGGSMIPFLVGGRDEAVLSLPDENFRFRVGDIILYRIEDGIYVLHRITRIHGPDIYTLGDAQTKIYGPIKREDIIAYADYIIRKGKKIPRSNPRYRILATIWRWIRPYRRKVMDAYTYLCRKIC